jgi:hypothetical protein
VALLRRVLLHTHRYTPTHPHQRHTRMLTQPKHTVQVVQPRVGGVEAQVCGGCTPSSHQTKPKGPIPIRAPRASCAGGRAPPAPARPRPGRGSATRTPASGLCMLCGVGLCGTWTIGRRLGMGVKMAYHAAWLSNTTTRNTYHTPLPLVRCRRSSVEKSAPRRLPKTTEAPTTPE